MERIHEAWCPRFDGPGECDSGIDPTNGSNVFYSNVQYFFLVVDCLYHLRANVHDA